MKNGEKIRFAVFEILLEIYKHNTSFESIFNSKFINLYLESKYIVRKNKAITKLSI